MLSYPISEENSEDNKVFLSKLYEKIFVMEEHFGWNDLFNLVPIFYSIVKFRPCKHNPSYVLKSEAQ